MMKQKIVFIFYLINTGISVQGFCQEGKILQDAGLKKLSVFLGTWKAANKPGSENTTTSVTTCGWSANGNYLICDQLIYQPEGESNNLSVYSYDSLRHSFLLSLVGIPNTDPFSIPMTARGDTLIYSGSYMDKGTKIYTRTLNIFKSASFYIYISQSSRDNISWTNTLEGSATKTTE